MRPDLFNTTAFRLSVGYTLLVMLAVSVTLGSAYLLTESLITDEVDLIIDTELQSLEEKFARSGVPGVTDEINLRIDSWGRIGAVYMLADANFERIAGNVTDWPFDGMPTERWPEFEIGTIEPGRRAVHPVRAAVRTLPGGDLLLVGTDISQGRRFADKFRFATLWGIGLSTLAAALAGFWFSYRLARRVGQVADTCQRIMAGEAGRRLPVAGTRDEFDSLAVSVNRVLDRLEEQARTLRATFDSAAHDLRAPLHRLRTRMDALLMRTPPLEPAVYESVDAALREVEHLQRTLATLLQIALAESGAPLGRAGGGGSGGAGRGTGRTVRAARGGPGPGTGVRDARPGAGAGQPPAARAAAHQSYRERAEVRAAARPHRGERAARERRGAPECERQRPGYRGRGSRTGRSTVRALRLG